MEAETFAFGTGHRDFGVTVEAEEFVGFAGGAAWGLCAVGAGVMDMLCGATDGPDVVKLGCGRDLQGNSVIPWMRFTALKVENIKGKNKICVPRFAQAAWLQGWCGRQKNILVLTGRWAGE